MISEHQITTWTMCVSACCKITCKMGMLSGYACSRKGPNHLLLNRGLLCLAY